MRIVEPCVGDGEEFSPLTDMRNSIFLAGPCPRKDFSDDWRFKAFEILEKIGFDGTVITPSNKNYKAMEERFSISKEDALWKQTEWERSAMHLASAIVFWIPRDKAHPARTTNVEFGEWYTEPNIFVGWPQDAENNEYLALKMKEQGAVPFHDLEQMLQAVDRRLNFEDSTFWFTSDTHFSQQRTLEFSRRPFVDTTEMDLRMFSNWNKRVTMNDTVVHAGDFCDIENIETLLPTIIGNLNFKKMHWVLGNYDRKVRDKIEKFVSNCDRDIVLHEKQYRFKTGTRSFVVVHEPNDFPIEAGTDDIILFGHIHGRSFAKRNGFDLGIDYHGYAPISLADVEWFANAMKYWDENVFSDRANVQTGKGNSEKKA